MSEQGDNRPLALLITRNFPPLLGGMEKVNYHLLLALTSAFRVSLCGPAGCTSFVPASTLVSESRLRPLPAFLIKTLWNALHTTIRNKPTWIIAGSGVTAPIAWLAGRNRGSKVAVYLHGLDVIANNVIYRALWLPFIRRCDLAFVNSTNTARLAREHGVAPHRLRVLHPGTDLPTLDETASRRIRDSLALGNRRVLLSVGRLTRRKGLAEFVAKALPLITARFPEALLIIVGENARDALQPARAAERERVLTEARAVGVERNILFVGRYDDAALTAVYQAADAHIFPVLDLPGDVEGFGMVALEAAAHGLPTIAFSVGGVPDAVRAQLTGDLIRPGDYEAFAAAVIRRLVHSRDAASIRSCQTFAASMTWDVFNARLQAILEESDARTIR